jgi:hypothetical protein
MSENGFGHEQLAEMQKIMDAEKSDIFDVLAHVAYALPPVTREVRAANARVYINTKFSAKQQLFLDFVLSHYVTVGVEELDQEKLAPLLQLKYHLCKFKPLAAHSHPDGIQCQNCAESSMVYNNAASFRGLVPSASNPRIRRSRVTDGSPFSIMATRGWLVWSLAARVFCVNPLCFRVASKV